MFFVRQRSFERAVAHENRSREIWFHRAKISRSPALRHAGLPVLRFEGILNKVDRLTREESRRFQGNYSAQEFNHSGCCCLVWKGLAFQASPGQSTSIKLPRLALILKETQTLTVNRTKNSLGLLRDVDRAHLYNWNEESLPFVSFAATVRSWSQSFFPSPLPIRYRGVFTAICLCDHHHMISVWF